MNAPTMQRRSMAAADLARVHGGYAPAYATVKPLEVNPLVVNLMAKGSWSIPCTTVATFHKPRPRRSKVNPS